MYFVVKALKEIKQGKRAPKAPTWPRNGDLDHLVKAQWVGIWKRKQSKQGKRDAVPHSRLREP